MAPNRAEPQSAPNSDSFASKSRQSQSKRGFVSRAGPLPTRPRTCSVGVHTSDLSALPLAMICLCLDAQAECSPCSVALALAMRLWMIALVERFRRPEVGCVAFLGCGRWGLRSCGRRWHILPMALVGFMSFRLRSRSYHCPWGPWDPWGCCSISIGAFSGIGGNLIVFMCCCCLLVLDLAIRLLLRPHTCRHTRGYGRRCDVGDVGLVGMCVYIISQQTLLMTRCLAWVGSSWPWASCRHVRTLRRRAATHYMQGHGTRRLVIPMVPRRCPIVCLALSACRVNRSV